MEVESFEGSTTIFRGNGGGLDFSLTTAPTPSGWPGSARWTTPSPRPTAGFGAGAYTSQWRAVKSTVIDRSTYNALHMWVYGDGSGNILSLLCSNGTKGYLTGGQRDAGLHRLETGDLREPGRLV